MSRLLMFGVMYFLLASCGQSGSSGSKTVAEIPGSEAKVQVYYFHGKQRCVTCTTVQTVAEEAMAEHYSGNKDVAFIEVDFSEKANEALAEKYEIVFSSLVIASGDDYKDITDEAFALAIRNPDGLKSLIARETNTFLNN